jgi:hypothetical protein
LPLLSLEEEDKKKEEKKKKNQFLSWLAGLMTSLSKWDLQVSEEEKGREDALNV